MTPAFVVSTVGARLSATGIVQGVRTNLDFKILVTVITLDRNSQACFHKSMLSGGDEVVDGDGEEVASAHFLVAFCKGRRITGIISLVKRLN